MIANYHLDNDRARLDMDVIHQFLSVDAYWSPGIAWPVVERAVAESDVIGAYHVSGAQVGFARAITDHATFAYIADVFVLPDHRGHGLARAMVAALLKPLDELQIRHSLLITRDAHSVYAPLGFGPPQDPSRIMRRIRPGTTST